MKLHYLFNPIIILVAIAEIVICWPFAYYIYRDHFYREFLAREDNVASGRVIEQGEKRLSPFLTRKYAKIAVDGSDQVVVAQMLFPEPPVLPERVEFYKQQDRAAEVLLVSEKGGFFIANIILFAPLVLILVCPLIRWLSEKSYASQLVKVGRRDEVEPVMSSTPRLTKN